MNTQYNQTLISYPINNLKGTLVISGDKSISHRAIILGSLTIGKTIITGLLEGEDVKATIGAVQKLGASVKRIAPGHYVVQGVGTGGYFQPDNVIDCGNAGTGVRLLIGAVATTPITVTFTGDSSLRSRPMGRVTEPIRQFGTEIHGRESDQLPMTVIGTHDPIPISYRLPVPSAQVKSAILLAGLNTPGQTEVIEESSTRDHTERMLKAFGAELTIENQRGAKKITLNGYAELQPQKVVVPGDPSSAAFLIAAGLLAENSTITVKNVGMNPTRTGVFKTLVEMGAQIDIEELPEQSGEPVANLTVRYSSLQGITVPPERAPTMIDEYPILAAVASIANGDTVMRGIKEMRIKETDRIHAMVKGLEECGVETTEFEDGFTVHGQGPGSISGDCTCRSYYDHRIAMSFLCLGLAARKPVKVDDGSAIATSFPEFVRSMNFCGAKVQEGGQL